MRLSLIAAVAQNGTLGRDGRVPWHLPVDLRWFKRWTVGHPVLMGRKTFDSVGKPLPARRNVVITRREGFAPPGVEVARSVEEALQRVSGCDEIFVVGGAEIYRETLLRADRLILTHIHRDFPGDAFFPPFDATEWRIVSREEHPESESNPLPFTFVVYERARPEKPA
jgi:dihydrofolate reductase